MGRKRPTRAGDQDRTRRLPVSHGTRSPLDDVDWRGGASRVTRALTKGLLVLAVCAWVLNALTSSLAGLVGTDLPSVWQLFASAFGVRETTVRLVLFVPVHVVIAVIAGPALKLADDRVTVGAHDLANRLWRKLGKLRAATVRLWGRRLGALATALVLVAFLLQPTLVPLRGPWAERAANLVDGTASASIVDSIVGLVRRVYAPPVRPSDVVGPEAFDASLASDVIPLMDRWDPYLLAAAGGDRELFAKTKAFMWVESGGRQFALSATGCAGLMQFCAATAQRRPFGSIFGVGRVSACGCDDCGVPLAVQIALETDPEAAEARRSTFPCDLSDARFDAERSIRAGVAFVRELGEDVGGHLALMYVGYNSGPRVASRLYRALPVQTEITVDELRPHLADALRPYHGSRADARANGLLEVHLPKLLQAYDRWKP